MILTADAKGTNRIHFTKAALAALVAPETNRAYWYDTRTPGLAFCITANGARTYYLYRKVAGKPERYRLGTHAELTVDQARDKAADLNGMIARGVNPNDQKRAAQGEPTLGGLWDWFWNRRCLPHLKATTREGYKNRWDVHLAKWKGRKLSEVTSDRVLRLHLAIGKDRPYVANRVLALLSAMFKKAPKAVGYRGEDPTDGIERFREQSRDRYLDGGELPRFFEALEALPDTMLRDYLKVLLFTGARRSNVAAMRWDELDIDAGVWRIPDAKNNKPQHVYLPPEALAILKARKADAETEWVFPSWGKTGHLTSPRKAWNNVLAAAGIADLHLHDLRRTLGSWQAATGASLPVIGKSLGHLDQNSTKVYSRLDLTPVKRSVDLAITAMLGTAKAKRKGGVK